jgi:hypothetical protein
MYTSFDESKLPHSGEITFNGFSGLIQNLIAYTVYGFDVYVINSVGESTPVSLVNETLPLAPTPPIIDNVVAINITALFVNWTVSYYLINFLLINRITLTI